ncbi:predicted protein [Naegleria gruberi]|uniref:Predicted protein n=1 Tax=Naegleria gruberi TaxID=5762 RepID=D2V9Z0_NAEGR|nr:uncharacterized protein NAEGRDRAFT_65677 [Naegleria gruberi]EFC46218.1 predicted protein [Naegleria gruberi]|eukprot:XP_002678962.1 predicted protein [Naegleria gruberi strain NEG-M]
MIHESPTYSNDSSPSALVLADSQFSSSPIETEEEKYIQQQYINRKLKKEGITTGNQFLSRFSEKHSTQQCLLGCIITSGLICFSLFCMGIVLLFIFSVVSFTIIDYGNYNFQKTCSVLDISCNDSQLCRGILSYGGKNYTSQDEYPLDCNVWKEVRKGISVPCYFNKAEKLSMLYPLVVFDDWSLLISSSSLMVLVPISGLICAILMICSVKHGNVWGKNSKINR